MNNSEFDDHEDYHTCPQCGINVHGDDLCPLEDIEEPEIWGCAKCAGYRLISSGWIRGE